MNNQVYVIAALDVILSVIVFFICFCRAVVSDKTVLRRVRLKFALLGPSALAFGLSPLWGDWPGWVNPLMLLAVVVGLLAETYQWRKGPPKGVRMESVRADLEAKGAADDDANH